jgi:CheY-like chemotaxis protein
MTTQNITLEASRAANLGVSAGPFVLIIVADSGPGMSEEVRARAFEPFFTTKEVGKGTGLGLSQVFGFVSQSGGHVQINSEVGQGTRVHLFIPAIEGGPEGEEQEDGAAQQPRQTLGTVLVVEDEPDVLDIAVQIFESLGYDVFAASNAAAALDVLRREDHIDVLFSDVVMPGGMNGVGLAREARRLRPGLKVLLASGYPMAALSEPELQEAAFISKPYRWTELDEKLRRLRTPQPR